MKRMITAFAVLVVVGGAFAFTPKADNYCLYQRSGTSCPLFERVETYSIVAETGGTQFIKNEDVNGNCPSAPTFGQCVQNISYTTND